MGLGETFKREIEITIPKNKRSENLERLLVALTELETAEKDKAEAMQGYNATLKDARATVRKLQHAIETGKHAIEVECFERLAGKNVELVRVDTGDVVDKRPATAEELQLDAFDDNLAGKAAVKRGRKTGAGNGQPEAAGAKPWHCICHELNPAKAEKCEGCNRSREAGEVKPKKRGRKPKAGNGEATP